MPRLWLPISVNRVSHLSLFSDIHYNGAKVWMKSQLNLFMRYFSCFTSSIEQRLEKIYFWKFKLCFTKVLVSLCKRSIFRRRAKKTLLCNFFPVLIHLSSFLFDIYFYIQKWLFHYGISTHQFELILLLLLPFLVEFNLPTFLNGIQWTELSKTMLEQRRRKVQNLEGPVLMWWV